MPCTVKIKYLLLTQGLRGYFAAHLRFFVEKSVGFYPPTFLVGAPLAAGKTYKIVGAHVEFVVIL